MATSELIAPPEADRARGRDRFDLLRGAADFVDDIERPGQLAGVIVRSQVAHGRLLGVDVSAAEGRPGVHRVLTAQDLTPPVPEIPIRSFSSPALEARKQPVLAHDRVRYVGEPVAVIVADDPYVAEDAADAVRVEIEPLTPALDASDPAGPPLWDELPDNTLASYEASDGDPDSAFASAKLIVEEEFRTGRHSGVPLETRGLIAEWSDNGETLEVWGPTKFLSFTQRCIADWFGLDPERVLLHHVAVGGMFGVRGEVYPEDFLIPWAARVVGKPVKWVEDRREHFLAINHGREMVIRAALALDDDGRFLGLRASMDIDSGAYARPVGGRIVLLAIEEMPGPYRWPSLELTAVGRATNKTPVGTVRAPVALEATFARERLIDIAARRLGRDPQHLRHQNLIAPDELPFTRRYGPGMHDQVYDSGDYPAMLEQLLKAADVDALRAACARKRDQGTPAGIGVGLFLAHSGLGGEERLTMSLIEGELVIQTAASEIGQGFEWMLRIVAAEETGLPIDRIRVISGTTIATPPTRGTFSSRLAIFAGSAVRDAAEKLFAEIATELGVEGEELRFRSDGLLRAGAQEVDLARLAPITVEGAHANPEYTFGFGGVVAMVSIEPVTGELSVDAIRVGYDCGHALDRAGVEAQLRGGCVMGIGGSLFEEFGFDASGQPLSTTFMDYLIPTSAEVPEVGISVFEYPSPGNPLGAKGAGEAGVIGVGAALANAAADALGDAPAFNRLPLVPSRILSALRA